MKGVVVFTEGCSTHISTGLQFNKKLCLFFFFLVPQPDELTDILEISNIVFTSMFVLEMIFKLMAFGLFGYIKNPYNIFDGIIVVIR